MEKVIKRSAYDIMNDSMKSYSAEVIVNRAFPWIQDGLKPSQRRVLFAMYNKGINKTTKSQTIIGNVMEIHPHGDQYDTMVGMTEPSKNQVSLFEGHGNWGDYASGELNAAAPRYTEVSMSDYGREMTRLLNQKVVPEIDSFNGDVKLPVIIPVTFPLITQYYTSGMGVGISCSHLPYNMREIADYYDGYISGKSNLQPLYPDFPMKASIIKSDSVSNVFFNGKGSIKLRGKAEIRGNLINIIELPFGVNRESVVNKVIDIAKNTSKLKEVTDIQDRTDFKGMCIEVTARKNANMEELLEKLYALTPLESNVNANANVIGLNGRPKVMGIPEILTEWHSWRVTIYREMLRRRIEKLTRDNHLYQGLKLVLGDLDTAINIIRTTKKVKLVKQLKEVFKLDDEQAQYVMNMKLYNINPDYMQDRIKEIDKNEAELKRSESLMNSGKRIDKAIIKEIHEIADKYGVERQTELIEPVDKKPVETLVQSDSICYIYLSQQGYVFKSYKPIDTESLTLKNNDSLIESYHVSESEVLEVVSGNNNIYGIVVEDIPSGVKKIGTYLPTLSKYDFDNVIGYFMQSSDNVIYGYSNGKMSKFKPNIKPNAKISKNGFNKDQELVFVKSDYNGDVHLHCGKYDVIRKYNEIPFVNNRNAKGNYMMGNRRENIEFTIDTP